MRFLRNRLDAFSTRCPGEVQYPLFFLAKNLIEDRECDHTRFSLLEQGGAGPSAGKGFEFFLSLYWLLRCGVSYREWPHGDEAPALGRESGRWYREHKKFENEPGGAPFFFCGFLR